MNVAINISESDISSMVRGVVSSLNERYNYNTLVSPKHGRKPRFFYHVSNPEYRESILEKGLVPSVGSSYSAHAEGEGEGPLIPVVFLSERNDYDSTWDDDRWRVDGSLIDYHYLYNDFDTSMAGCYVYTKVIPPQALTLIHKGTGK